MVPDCILHKNNNPKMYVQNENDNKKYKYLLYKYKQFKYRNMKERNKNGEIYRNKMIEGNQYNARLLSHDFICMWLSKKIFIKKDFAFFIPIVYYLNLQSMC